MTDNVENYETTDVPITTTTTVVDDSIRNEKNSTTKKLIKVKSTKSVLRTNSLAKTNLSTKNSTIEDSATSESINVGRQLRRDDASKSFRPSSKIIFDEPLDQFDENGNSPWAPRHNARFDNQQHEDAEEYYVDENYVEHVRSFDEELLEDDEDDDEDDEEVHLVEGGAQPRQDDDESIRVAVWVDPSLKSNMGGIMNGLGKLVKGRSTPNNNKKKNRKPNSGYGNQNQNQNSNPLKSLTNLFPKGNKNNNNNQGYGSNSGGGGGGKGGGFKLPNLGSLLPKGQSNSAGQYGGGQGQGNRRPKLPSLPKFQLPSLKGTRAPSGSSYGAPPSRKPASGGGGISGLLRLPKKKKNRNRQPAADNSLPSTPPDFIFGPPFR